MARFDVYLNKASPLGRCYLVDVQSDWLDHINTTIVLPAFPVEMAPAEFKHLNPLVQIEEIICSLHPELMGAIERHELSHKVGNLTEEQDKISNALDMLFQGY